MSSYAMGVDGKPTLATILGCIPIVTLFNGIGNILIFFALTNFALLSFMKRLCAKALYSATCHSTLMQPLSRSISSIWCRFRYSHTYSINPSFVGIVKKLNVAQSCNVSTFFKFVAAMYSVFQTYMPRADSLFASNNASTCMLLFPCNWRGCLKKPSLISNSMSKLSHLPSPSIAPSHAPYIPLPPNCSCITLAFFFPMNDVVLATSPCRLWTSNGKFHH